ncbi:transmembrane protein 106B [Aplysia californica]|uniref:Transmembrane protein 106B n=1 Tax=Aplysia californica TaxID=6500 RepID=A0ABM1VSE5_APLCA|nr:transmembrane protein 106B [Aplysia californica]
MLTLRNMANTQPGLGENTRLLPNSRAPGRDSQGSGTSGSDNVTSHAPNMASHSHNNMASHSSSNTATTSNGSAGGDSYEELFKDSVPCPSCRGLGRVPKELENQLVALIPMKDGRLKPRRTILYVAIAVSLCVVTGGLLIFFLMPRDIVISSNRPFLQPKHIDINSTSRFANFTVTNHYNVSNNNFYPVKISGVYMKSLYSNAIIAQAWAYKKDPLEISARSEEELSVPIDFVLSGEHGSLVSHCISNWSWIHNLPILFEVTTNYTYMGHSEQATLTTFQTVSCHPEPPPKPSTIRPPSTTPTSTPATSTSTKPSTSTAPKSTPESPSTQVPPSLSHSHADDRPTTVR